MTHSQYQQLNWKFSITSGAIITPLLGVMEITGQPNHYIIGLFLREIKKNDS